MWSCFSPDFLLESTKVFHSSWTPKYSDYSCLWYSCGYWTFFRYSGKKLHFALSYITMHPIKPRLFLGTSPNNGGLRISLDFHERVVINSGNNSNIMFPGTEKWMQNPSMLQSWQRKLKSSKDCWENTINMLVHWSLVSTSSYFITLWQKKEDLIKKCIDWLLHLVHVKNKTSRILQQRRHRQ